MSFLEENKSLIKQILFGIGTFLIYYAVFGWQLAAILITTIGLHESSHLWAARRMNLKTNGFYLIPFVGGAALSDKPKTYGQLAFVVIAGPAGGTLLALAFTLIYLMTNNPVYANAAWLGAMVNLFNLSPFYALDGGQIVDSITYSISSLLGLIVRCIMFVAGMIVIWHFNVILCFIIGFVGFFSIGLEIKNYNHFKKGETYLVDKEYLDKPKPMSKSQIHIAIGATLAVVGILLMLLSYLGKLPDVGWQYLIHK